jgi:ABC-2 type transport system permease protein
MTAVTSPTPSPTPTLLPAPRHRPWSGFYGFASVYAKSIRDARLSFLIVLGLTAGLMLSVTSAIPSAFPTQAARDEMARLATEMGAVAQGLAGKPVNVGTLGGYAQWKYGAFFALILSLWSILALSGTLAGEARRGSLDILAVTPIGRRRLAGEKVAAHLTLMAVVVAAVVLAASVAGAAFGTLPGDAIPMDRALGFGLWIGLMALAFGGLAFALSQVVGRGAGAGISGGVLVAGWILNGYAPTVPLFQPFALLTPWAWTGDHLPLAGQSDWGSLVPVALVAALALPLGVRLFERRDLGATRAVRTPGFLALPKGLGGPLTRSVGERLPVALAWAIGIGLYGLFVAAASRSFVEELAKSPDIARFFQGAFPGADMLSAGGFLQFVFVDMGIVVAGFAAAALVAGWASDETSGRVEQLLTAPVSRRAWLARSAAGVLVAIGVITGVLMVAVAVGSASAGSDWSTPFLGAIPVGLYAAALAGVGFAVGGVWRPSLAAEVVALVVIATFLVQLLGPLLGLPDAVQQLALTKHLGRPMIGQWDWPGMVACVTLALGGLALGAWGFARRDVRD